MYLIWAQLGPSDHRALTSSSEWTPCNGTSRASRASSIDGPHAVAVDRPAWLPRPTTGSSPPRRQPCFGSSPNNTRWAACRDAALRSAVFPACARLMPHICPRMTASPDPRRHAKVDAGSAAPPTAFATLVIYCCRPSNTRKVSRMQMPF